MTRGPASLPNLHRTVILRETVAQKLHFGAQEERLEVRPIILDCAFVPEHPAYWLVPESASAGVALLVEAGQVEYEPSYTRTEIAGPALQLVTDARAGRVLARRGR